MYADGMTFDHLFRANFYVWKSFITSMCVRDCRFHAIFFMEQDNETLKKFSHHTCIEGEYRSGKISSDHYFYLSSILWLTYLFLFLGGLIVSGVEDILYRLLISILLGILIGIATLPIILVIVYFNKKFYIFPLSFPFYMLPPVFAITLFFSLLVQNLLMQ